MKLLFFCPRWGQEHTDWDSFCQRVKNAGYDGVEVSLPYDEQEKNHILQSLQQYGLLLIAQHWETVEKDFGQHCQQFEQRLRNLASAKPLFINTQTGKDYYDFEKNAQLIALADSVAKETGVTIVHETHRGKFSFAAHVAQQYFEKSLTILEAQLPQEARSYEAIGTDYVAMLEIIGEDGKAGALKKRMEKVLAKV